MARSSFMTTLPILGPSSSLIPVRYIVYYYDFCYILVYFLNFCRWIGHTGDFTPVCTTELGAMAKYAHEFDKRGVKLLGLSCDDVQSHKDWIKDIEAFTVYLNKSLMHAYKTY